ncbi:uncharacterized protein [Thunnus thynnus]|uniref:uncharacterized protein n=1 Tax=Thunnus thynnus TaxID=8237 RepID=UPI003529B03B
MQAYKSSLLRCGPPTLFHTDIKVLATPSPAHVTESASRPSPAVRQVEAAAQESVEGYVVPLSAGVVPKVVGEEVAAACPAMPMESTIEEGARIPHQISKAKSSFAPCFSVPDVKAAQLHSNSNAVAVVGKNSRGIRLVKVVRGSFHQGDEQFIYRGLQCMAIALVSLTKHTVSSVFLWERHDLDHMLVIGDKFYSSLCDSGVLMHQSDLLSVPDLPQQLVIDGQVRGFSFGDVVLGEVDVTEGELVNFGVFISLYNGLERIFSQYSTCLLTLCFNTSAIICKDGQFAMVDRHSRSYIGLLHCNGTSVVLHFACLDDLHHYICHLANNSRQKQYELCGVSVSVVYH